MAPRPQLVSSETKSIWGFHNLSAKIYNCGCFTPVTQAGTDDLKFAAELEC